MQNQKMRVTCTWHNTDDHEVRFGPKTTDEMCFILGFYYREAGPVTGNGCLPAKRGLLCPLAPVVAESARLGAGAPGSLLVVDGDGRHAVLLDAGGELVGRVGRVVEREQVAVLVLVGERAELEGLVGLVVVRAGPLEAAHLGCVDSRVADEGRVEIPLLVVELFAGRAVPRAGGELDAPVVVVPGQAARDRKSTRLN